MIYAVIATIMGGNSYAQELPDKLTIKPFLDLTAGLFYSSKSYDAVHDESKKWQEIYAKYGLSTDYQLHDATVYASVKGISTGSFDDGDASGVTNGNERRTSLEEWRIGWRYGTQEATKIDLSLGRQSIQIADGFLVASDALNLGEGAAELNRGGAYYLAARRSFDFTTMLDYQFTELLRSHWYYLESNNKAQYQPTLWATDWQYSLGYSDLGFTFLQVIDVKDPVQQSRRDDLKDYALRFSSKINDQLNIRGEYVHQVLKSDHEKAWYAHINYVFDQLPWQPTIGYRFSSFSEHYDPLFYGNTDAGFGTWFQGEIAGNYAGPYNTNARIHQVSVQASMKENLHLGILGYQFNSLDKTIENLDGHEIDIFTVWSPTQHLNVMPLIGFYRPKKYALNGGTQMGGNGTNTYAQLLLQYVY